MKTNGLVGVALAATWLLRAGLLPAHDAPAPFQTPVTGVTRISDAHPLPDAPPPYPGGRIEGVPPQYGPPPGPGYHGPAMGHIEYGGCDSCGSCAPMTDWSCQSCCPPKKKGCCSRALGWIGLGGDDECECEDGGCGCFGGGGGCLGGDCFHLYAPDRTGWFFGGAALWLDPDFDDSVAFTIEDQTQLPFTTTTDRLFGFNEEDAFRAWVGYNLGCGRALRVTGFRITGSTRETATAAEDFVFFNGPRTPTTLQGLRAGGVAGDTIAAKGSYEIFTIDVEFTQELNFDRWQTTVGGGYRHAAILNQYRATGTSGPFTSFSEIDRRFDGDGATIFHDTRIPVLGRKDRRVARSIGFSLVATTRASIVFGHDKFSADDRQGNQFALAQFREDETVAIGELMLGGQLDIRPCCGTLVFVRGGWEAQYYSEAGSPSDPDSDLGLKGWSVSGGVDW